MTAFVDTNVIIRYLTDDPPEMAAEAGRILDRVPNLQISGVMIAEAAHVLRSQYGMGTEAIVDALVALLKKENIEPFGLDKDVVVRALMMCRPSRRVNIADAMLWATARSTSSPIVYSFDRKFPSEGIELHRLLGLKGGDL